MKDISYESVGAEFVIGQNFDEANPRLAIFPSSGHDWPIPIPRNVLRDAGVKIEANTIFIADVNPSAVNPDELAPDNIRPVRTETTLHEYRGE